MSTMPLPIRTMDVSIQSLRALRRDQRATNGVREVRSTQALRDEIRSLLADELPDSELLVLMRGGRVSLGGCVASELERQLAEDLVWCMPEVWECDNQLRVYAPQAA